MSPYNPNGVWTGKDNPNLPGAARSLTEKSPVAASVPSSSSPAPSGGAQQDAGPHEELNIQPPHKRSFMSRWGLWIFGIGIVVVIGGIVAAVILMSPPAQPATELTITPPSAVSVGVPFAVSISAANDSKSTLTGAVLTLQIPQGVQFVGSDSSTQVQEYPLGDVAPGAVMSQSSTLIVTGNPSQLYGLSAKLVYTTPQTPSTTYQSTQSISFTPGQSQLALNYSAPTNIVSGQPFPITLDYSNNSNQTIGDVKITLQYPPAYTFTTSSVALATGTAVTASSQGTWDIGALSPGQGGSITVTGAIVGPSQAQYQFTGTAYTILDGREYAANIQPVSFTLVPSPLDLEVSVNNAQGYVSSVGDDLHYNLTYTNNSAVTLSSVKISASLSGVMYNFASLQTSGAFNSKTDTITWYAANTPALASLAPGQSGSVSFDIKTQAKFPIRLASDKDYYLMFTGTIQSPTVIPGASGSSTVSTIAVRNKVGGEIAFTSAGYWKSGPYPPKVNQETDYTIDWTITNYSTDASNVVVSAYLQSGTTFLSAASSAGTTSTPVYNSGTGLVTWTIPYIPAGTGIIDAPMKAAFTVANTPAVNQVGSDVTLLGKTTLVASDTWTDGSFNISADPVTTALPNDASVGGNGARTVTQ